MEFQELKIKPLSVNKCWQGRRYKTKNYNQYQRDVLLMLKSIKIPEPPLKVVITYGFSSKLADIDNPCKPFLDILQKKYGFDDRDIFELNQKKRIVSKGEEFIKFNISKIIEKNS